MPDLLVPPRPRHSHHAAPDAVPVVPTVDRLLAHCRGLPDSPFALDPHAVSVALQVTRTTAAKAIYRLIGRDLLLPVPATESDRPLLYELAPTDPTPAPPSLEDVLLAHCLALAAASDDGVFLLPGMAASDVLDVQLDAALRVVNRVVDDGRLVRISKGGPKVASAYAIGGSPAAIDHLAPRPAPRMTCPSCGVRYAPGGPVDTCPNFLNHPRVRAVWRRTTNERTRDQP